MDELLHQGIAAARSGQRKHARDLLIQVVDQDEENVTAWLWLSSVVDNLEDREVCLENVLALDPTHKAARQGLAWVRQQKEGVTSISTEIIGAPPSPTEVPPPEPTQAREPVSPAAAILRQDQAFRQPSPEPEPPSVPLEDEFDNEYLCPYCAGQTEPDDRKCLVCGNRLWIRSRRRVERSSWLWVAMTLQAATIIWPAFTLLVVLFYVSYQIGLDYFFKLVPAYLGLATDLPAETAKAAFELLPRLYVLALVVFILFAFLVLAGLYLRWKPIFYLFLLNAILMIAIAITGITVGLGLPSEETIANQRVGTICGGVGLFLALLMFLLVLQIVDDFFFDEKRLLLRPDRDATNGPALLDSGQRYAKQSMWAMAAIHLRRATSRMPDRLDPHLALSVVYLNLKRYELAVSALEEARLINPDDPKIEHLASVLANRLAAENSSVANINV